MRRAVVLAGGLGTRLRPYTTVLPKPLLPVGDRPVIDIVLRQLSHHGFERVTVATGHLAELLEAFVRDGAAYGLKVDYFREREPLGTVGALALIEDLEDDFLVMNGDVLTDLDFARLLDDHRRSDAAATVATKSRELEISLGVLHFDAQDPTRLVDYTEKPTYRFEASMGVYGFSRAVVAHIEPGTRLDFPDLVLRLIAAGETVRGWRSGHYWLDIGRHTDYEQALNEFEAVRSRLLPPE